MNLDLMIFLENALKEGMNVICASCDHYRAAVTKNVPTSCVGVRPNARICGGPPKGLTFPEYKGFLVEDVFALTCFLTGDNADYGVQVGNSPRRLGISKGRIHDLAVMCQRSDVPVYLIDGNHQSRLLNSFLRKPKNSLGDLLVAWGEGQL